MFGPGIVEKRPLVVIIWSCLSGFREFRGLKKNHVFKMHEYTFSRGCDFVSSCLAYCCTRKNTVLTSATKRVFWLIYRVEIFRKLQHRVKSTPKTATPRNSSLSADKLCDGSSRHKCRIWHSQFGDWQTVVFNLRKLRRT